MHEEQNFAILPQEGYVTQTTNQLQPSLQHEVKEQ